MFTNSRYTDWKMSRTLQKPRPRYIPSIAISLADPVDATARVASWSGQQVVTYNDAWLVLVPASELDRYKSQAVRVSRLRDFPSSDFWYLSNYRSIFLPTTKPLFFSHRYEADPVIPRPPALRHGVGKSPWTVTHERSLIVAP